MNSRKSAYFSISLAATLLAGSGTFAPAEAAWLKAIGSPDTETPVTFSPLKGGGYFISGASGDSATKTPLNHWYARLDEQGRVIWSKSTGDVTVTVAEQDGQVKLFQAQSVGTKTISVTATGTLDPATGNITGIVADKERTIDAQGNLLFEDPEKQGGLIFGTWKSTPDNTDAAIAKLDASNQVVWSHRYDFDAQDSIPSVYPLKQGYLLTLLKSDFDPATSSLTFKLLLAKLDANGAIVPGTTKTVSATGNTLLAPDILDDDSVILIGIADDKPGAGTALVKLNGNLDVVWSKRLLGSPADRLTTLLVTEKSGGVLEFTPSRRVLDSAKKVTDQHPLRIRINRDTGALVDKKEIRVKAIDPIFLTHKTDDTYSLTGTTSDIADRVAEDGLFASFQDNLDKKWARTVAGSQHDGVRNFTALPSKDGFLLTGDTESWGAGKADMLIAKLDANGTVASCPAITDVNPVITDPDLRLEDFTPAITPATLTDNGPFTVTVTETQPTLTVNPTDYPLTVTDICEAKDTGGGNGGGNGGNGGSGNGGNNPTPQPGGISDTNVASGDTLNISGSGFTSKRGRVIIGNKKAKILTWSDNAIGLKLPAKLKAGVYTVKVVTKGGAVEVSEITVYAPTLTQLAPTVATSGGTLVISGQYFGTGPQKPKVLLTGTQRRSGKVTGGFTDSRLDVTLPRLKPGSYQLAVKTRAGLSNLLDLQVQ